MIDPERVTEAVMEFMKNPTWKEIFKYAPGGAMERLAISFYFSKFHDQFKPEDFQEYRDLRDEYEKSMTEEDLNYLIENSDKPNAKKHYEELLAKLQEKGGQPEGQLRFEKGEGEEGEKVEEPASKEEQGEQTAERDGGEGQQSEETAVEGQEASAEGEGNDAPPEEEKPVEGQEAASHANPQGNEGDAQDEGGEEEPAKDEKYDTALSVALEYLQNEKKK